MVHSGTPYWLATFTTACTCSAVSGATAAGVENLESSSME
jgi:hypothetical protein